MSATPLPIAPPPGPDAVTVGRSVWWKYTSLPKVGVCRVDGRHLRLELRLEHRARSVPDVLEVERWLDTLLSEPTTVEEVAVAATLRWNMVAVCVGRSDSHGEIWANCSPL